MLSPSTSHRMVTILQPAPRRGRFFILGLLALVAVAAALAGGRFLNLRQSQAVVQDPAASAPSPRTVLLEVKAAPAEADIIIDGKAAGANVVKLTRPASSTMTNIEVRAPGYVPEVRALSLDKDISLEMTLTPLPVADGSSAPGAHPTATTPAPASASPARGGPRVVAQGSRKAPPAAVVVAAPRASSTAPAAPTVKEGCNPPYTLSPDGVKTYKPDCF